MFLLQIDPSGRACRVRAYPRVAELMYPVLLYLRSLTIGHVFLQIAPWRRVCLARACPRVPRLMYPSRTRAVLSV
jgi:hypothetical protein